MTELRELHIEQAAIEWLQNLGYTYNHGQSIQRDVRSVVLEEELLEFISNKYQQLPAEVAKEAVKEFTNNKGADLDYRNRDFHLKLTQGIDISWKNQ